VGGPHFESEVANVAEIGYRAQPFSALGVSVTSFLHRWDKLRSGSALPVEIENGIEGDVYGVEAWLTYRPLDFWSLSAGGTWMQEKLHLDSRSEDPVGVDNPTLRNDPEYYWTLRSMFDLTQTVQLDLWLYGAGALPEPQVPAYTELELRLAWTLLQHVELSIVGRNLLHDSHPEYGDMTSRSEIERTVYGQVQWQF
jgi:iron complex outermembrane receptor protein